MLRSVMRALAALAIVFGLASLSLAQTGGFHPGPGVLVPKIIPKKNTPGDTGTIKQALGSGLTLILAGTGHADGLIWVSEGAWTGMCSFTRVCSFPPSGSAPAVFSAATAINNPGDDSNFVRWVGCQTTGTGDCTTNNLTGTVVAFYRRTTVAPGAFFTCVLKQPGGAVRCWGNNDHGELGDGTWATPYDGSVHTVMGITNAVALGGGAYHSCALIADGTVWCWGSNKYGEIDSTTSTGFFPSPKQITLNGFAIDLAVGGFHTCVLMIDQTVKCWGLNSDGQSGGVIAPGPTFIAPTTIPGISGALSLAAGAYHSCAILGDGSIQCWGLNNDFELGRDTGMPHGGPTTLRRFTNIGPQGAPIAIAGAVGAGVECPACGVYGGYHSCGVFADGNIGCWGLNNGGQVSGRLTAGEGDMPTGFSATPAQGVAAGGWHSCGVGADHKLYCWGDDQYGELGTGTNRGGPQDAGLASAVTRPVVSVGAGTSHTCVVAQSASGALPPDVLCFGANEHGQTGPGGGTAIFSPVKITY